MADIIGYIATIIAIVTFVPQVVKSWQTRKTKDLSLITLIFMATGATLWLFYGVLLGAMPIIIANAVVDCCVLSLLYLKLTEKK